MLIHYNEVFFGYNLFWMAENNMEFFEVLAFVILEKEKFHAEWNLLVSQSIEKYEELF